MLKTTPRTGVEEKEEAAEIARTYDESGCFQCSARFCGACCYVFLGMCVVAWVFHSIVLAKPDPCFHEFLAAENEDREPNCSEEQLQKGREHFDLAPAFSKTLIWMSIAHHTEPWQEHWRRSAPPPPPTFRF